MSLEAAEKARQRDPLLFRLEGRDEFAVVSCYHGNQRANWSIMRGHTPAPVDMVRWLLGRIVQLEGQVEDLERGRGDVAALARRLSQLERQAAQRSAAAW